MAKAKQADLFSSHATLGFDAKMKRLGAELDQLFKESNRLEQLVRKNLAAIGKEAG